MNNPAPMTILALEFSSAQRSVAVAGRKSAAGPDVLAEVIETGGRSVNALQMISTALKEAGIERGQVDCLAVGIGPGSYTGIRGAISVAQGWQLALATRLLAISSAECIAAQAQLDGLVGRVDVVIDAQRGEYYIASWEISSEERAEIIPLRLASAAEVESGAKAGALLVGPEIIKRFPGSRDVFPRASMLARLAFGRTDFIAGENCVPIYLRETTFVKAPPPRWK